MTEQKRKIKCRCRIVGIYSLAVRKKYYDELIHPDDYVKNLRKFKYCPLCGKERTKE